jgi:S1-C subfamily serine protease
MKTIVIISIASLALVDVALANENVYDKTLQSTAWILGATSTGTGVLVDEDKKLILTNCHVTQGQEKIHVVFPVMNSDRAESDGEFYLNDLDKYGTVGTVVACDKLRDIAIIQVEELPAGVVEIAFGKPGRPGQTVHSIGNPAASDALWIYTHGKVRQNYYRKSQIKDYGSIQMQMLETDSPINPGDSGGPIVNDNGELIGLTQSMSMDSRLYSYGVDISEVTWYLNKFRSSKTTLTQTETPEAQETSSTQIAGSFNDLPMFRKTDTTRK